MLTKFHLVKSMAFPVVMYGCESWTIKKPEHGRIDALNCGVGEFSWVPWTARRSNQSILKEISPKHSLEGLILKLKFQTLATWWKKLTHWKRPWFGEILKAGGEGDDRGRHDWMASPAQYSWVWTRQGSLACCSPRGHTESDTTEVTELNHSNGKQMQRKIYLKYNLDIVLAKVLAWVGGSYIC